MSEFAKTIWAVPAYLPYVQPTLTDDALTSAKEALGYPLPCEYVELLRVQNGGYIRFSLPEIPHCLIAGIGPYFPSLLDFSWEDCEEFVTFSLSGLVPFDGDGHWHLCLDYREDAAAPSVTYVDMECDEEVQIAPSFADYLRCLRIDHSDEWVVDVSDVGVFKQQLESELGGDACDTDTQTYGYPVERIQLGTESNPQWLWISPNRVPRGFVRREHARYDELRPSVGGEALRYPEVRADAYLLSATDGVRERVLEACANLRLRVEPLRAYVE